MFDNRISKLRKFRKKKKKAYRKSEEQMGRGSAEERRGISQYENWHGKARHWRNWREKRKDVARKRAI